METTEATGRHAKCKECGGTLTWDPAAGALRCASCGATRAPEPGDGPASGAGAGGGAGLGGGASAGAGAAAGAAAGAPPGVVVEHDLVGALSRTKPRWNLGSAARQVKCQECGAVVEFPDGVAATRCSFGASPTVRAQDARADLIAPESLIPFAVGRDDAIGRFKGWLGKLWFRPSDLRDKASVSELHGVYVPFWTFDCQVTSRWTADDGEHYFTNAAFERYNSALREHCSTEGAAFVDMFGGWRSREYTKFLADGLHPNSRGYALMADSVRECLKGLGLR